MGDPKVILELKQVVYDSDIVLAETVLVAAAQDMDDCTGYAGTTEPTGTGNITLAAVAARIEHPRNVVVTISGGNATAGYVKVYGMGCKGVPVSELFTITSGACTLTGNVPFLTVDKANVWAVTGSLGASDHVSIGNGAKIGLPMAEDAELVDVIKERFNKADIAVTPANIDRTYGTYTPGSTLDGAKPLELWYTVKTVLKW